MTPVITRHALKRCVEMGISTKVAKRIFRNAEVRYDSRCSDGNTGIVMLWSGDPNYAIVVAHDEPVVLTVIFNTRESYVRDGITYQLDAPV